MLFSVWDHGNLITIVTPALVKQPLDPSRNLLKKCGSLGDILVLYLLPLLVYVPIGLMIHMYWFVSSQDYAGYQTLSFYFGGIYLGSLLIYMIISTLYQWVRVIFFSENFFYTQIFIPDLSWNQTKDQKFSN